MEAPALAHEKRRLAAIVSLDVVGYSRLMGRNESGTHALFKSHLVERVVPCLRRHVGRLVKLTGDGLLAEFGSAVEALSAVIELQQEMANVNRAPSDADQDKIVFRAGVHLGEVIVEDNDLYGDAVNVAVRLQGEAPAGGILISRAVRQAVSGRVKVDLHALGEMALKNITRPIRAFRVEWNEADWPTGTDAQPKPPDGGPVPFSSFPLDDKPSIAVLPFVNMSDDAEQAYFADGVTDEIITALSRFHSLFVIARNSTFAYKGKAVDVRTIARELGVRYVLAGSIRRAGSRVRISGQLAQADSGIQIWAERYDGDLADIFDLQDRVASDVV